MGVLFLSFVCWNVAVFHCSLVRIYPSGDYKGGIDYGLYRAAVYTAPADGSNQLFDNPFYTCSAYHSPHELFVDVQTIRTSRAFGVLGIIFQTVALLLVLAVELCLTWRRKHHVWNIVRVCLVMSMICSGLIFVDFSNKLCTDIQDLHCAPGPGGIVAICNMLFTLVAVVLSWVMKAPSHPLYRV